MRKGEVEMNGERRRGVRVRRWAEGRRDGAMIICVCRAAGRSS